MKETMTKRFFAPIWRCDEIEAELERLENEGWRLEKISGFRKFKFIKASPKTTKYFLTCSFVKESGMIQTELLLKREYKATEIHGSFIEGLKTTSIYRITREADLKQRKVYRNMYLRFALLLNRCGSSNLSEQKKHLFRIHHGFDKRSSVVVQICPKHLCIYGFVNKF